MRAEGGNLFGGPLLGRERASRAEEAVKAVERMPIDELLTRDIEDLVAEVVQPFGRAELEWSKATMTEPEGTTTVELGVLGRSVQRAYATSMLRVPVVGSSLLLTYRSERGAPLGGPLPGVVRQGVVEFPWTGALTAEPSEIQRWADALHVQVDAYLAHNNQDVEDLNAQMRRDVRHKINMLCENELARRKLADRLPYPLERSPSAVRLVPVQRRRVQVARPAPSGTFAPEPALEDAQYEEILRDCVAMGTIFERVPSVERMEEEEVRNLFLGMLNTNYTGAVAGEVFNGAGKTDICIRADDRNVFISECKFYDGPSKVTDALDQLLSYLVWRDTKAALLLFMRGANFTQAVERATEAVRSHPSCQRAVTAKDPARRSDYTFAREDDPQRFIRLALLPFPLRS